MIYIYLCVILSVSMTFVVCDYKCLCNYNVEKAIYSKASTTGDVLGYMYEFDCKPSANAPKADGWSAVAFENQLGFAENDANLQTQTCPGSIPDEDKLPSKPTPITQSTIFQTTSTVQTTTKMLTQTPTVSPSSASVINNFTTAGTPPVTVPPSTVTSTTTTTLSNTPAATTKTTIMPSTVTTPSKTSPTKTSPTTASTSTTTTASTTKTSPTTTSTSTTTTASTTKTYPTSASTTTATTTATTTKAATTTATASTTASTATTATTHTHTTSGPTEMCPLSIRSDAQRKGAQLAQFRHKCYEVLQNRVSWATAEITCQRNRGHLVDIASQQEQNFLFHFLESIKSHTVWLGLHDRNEEEKFEWTSGKPVVYTDWKQDRKDKFYHDKHDCVYMTVNGTWDDIYCGSDGLSASYLHAYVCQYQTVSGPQVVG